MKYLITMQINKENNDLHFEQITKQNMHQKKGRTQKGNGVKKKEIFVSLSVSGSVWVRVRVWEDINTCERDGEEKQRRETENAMLFGEQHGASVSIARFLFSCSASPAPSLEQSSD